MLSALRVQVSYGRLRLMQMIRTVQMSFLVRSSKLPILCDYKAVLSISRLAA